jgi:hypothetical protein
MAHSLESIATTLVSIDERLGTLAEAIASQPKALRDFIDSTIALAQECPPELWEWMAERGVTDTYLPGDRQADTVEVGDAAGR